VNATLLDKSQLSALSQSNINGWSTNLSISRFTVDCRPPQPGTCLVHPGRIATLFRQTQRRFVQPVGMSLGQSVDAAFVFQTMYVNPY
jgi:hypothetical protein